MSPSSSPSLKAQELGTLMSEAGEDGCPCPCSEQVCPSSTCPYYAAPQWIGCHPPGLVRVSLVTQTTDSNAKPPKSL